MAALLLAIGGTAILAVSARPVSSIRAPAVDRTRSSAPMAAPSPVEIRLGRASAGPVLAAAAEPEGRIDPGPLVGTTGRDALAEAIAGLHVTGTPTGIAMRRGGDLTGSVLVPTGLAGGGSDIGTILDPTGTGAGPAGRASFMGLEATGRRFLIIADRSSSMSGAKFERLRAEMIQTIKGLKPGGRFYVIFYSDGILPYPQARWLSGRRDAGAFFHWLGGIGPGGNTEPLPAFEAAFTRLKPRPDAIFFMTDGLFSDSVADAIPPLNSGRKPVPIHTISLVDRSAEALLRRIAGDSGGTYRHVDLAP